MPGSFVEMFLTVPVSEWKVAVRWKEGEPLQLFTADEARERADRADEEGDSELAEALRQAAMGVAERMTLF
jgi:hypothetical protein